MNTSSPQESTTKYYSSTQSAGAWVAMVACFGVITTGSSLAAHSFILTFCLLFGTIVVGYLGYWVLSKTCYFISADKAGFKDAFRAREVQFDEVQSVTKDTGRSSSTLTFVCKTGEVTMPLDPLDQGWFSAVKAELLKRGISVQSTAFGFALKENE